MSEGRLSHLVKDHYFLSEWSMHACGTNITADDRGHTEYHVCTLQYLTLCDAVLCVHCEYNS